MKEQEHTPFWLWLNLLSLDAPLIAVVWQEFLMRCYPTLLRAPARWVLGLTVWAIYLADRLLDTRHPFTGDESPRHSFYRRHRGLAVALLIGVLVPDLLIATIGLRPDVFSSGLAILGGVLLYLTLFALLRVGVQRCKHPSAAVLFTIGVFLVACTRTGNPLQTLGRPAAAFFAVCLANLALIESWEQRRSSGKVWLWMMCLVAVCAAIGDSRWYIAVSASAAGLAILDLSSAKLDRNARHVLADAALLTPLLFL